MGDGGTGIGAKLRGVWGEMWAALIGSIALVPGLAGVWTVVLAVLAGETAAQAAVDFRGRTIAVAVGFGLGILSWVVFAFVARTLAGPDRANIRMFRELSQRSAAARQAHDVACAADGTDPVRRAACREAAVHLDALARAIGTTETPPARGPEWALGFGYIAAWQQLHRAEEALLAVSETSTAATGGLYDVKRLEGSRIANRKQLIGIARAAVGKLSPGLAAHLPADDRENVVRRGARRAELLPALTEPEARATLRQTRRIINEYRDDAAAGLVTLRRRLTGRVVFTGLTGYLLLALAVIAAVPLVVLVSGSVIYLIGALIGLAHGALAESKIRVAKELDDYGLGTARMIHGAMLSGMTAIAGVAIVGMLSGMTLAEAIVPDADVVDLATIFNLLEYPAALVVAAVFGLTPGLLFRSVSAQGDALQKKLASSEPNGGADADEEPNA